MHTNTSKEFMTKPKTPISEDVEKQCVSKSMFTEVSARDSQRYQKDWFVVATIDNDPRRTDTAKIFEIKLPPIR